MPAPWLFSSKRHLDNQKQNVDFHEREPERIVNFHYKDRKKEEKE